MRKEVYKIEKYDAPIKKSYKDIEKYEVARFEYGDFDNWINAIILDVKLVEVDYGGGRLSTRADIHFLNTFGDEDTCYSSVYNGDIDFDIIGKAVKLENEKTKDEQEAPMSMN